MWKAIVSFYNSPTGRKVVNWGTTALGVLMSAGVIPLDMPIGPTSLGTILTILGLRLPSQPPVAATMKLGV